MVRVSPTAHVSPPLGAVKAREPRILKFAGDVWVTVASLLRVIRTFTVVEIASGTVQAKLPPAAGVESVMVWTSAAKLSREYSSFTSARVPPVGPLVSPVAITTVSVKSPFFEYSRLTVGIAPAPVEVQETVLTTPTFQTSVPTGLVTLRPPLTVKVLGEDDWTVAENSGRASEMRTFTVAEATSGIVQVYVPVFAVEATITVEVAKLSVEYSSFTFARLPVLVQAIVAELPTVKIWPATMPGVGLWAAIVPLTVKFASETSLVGGRFVVFEIGRAHV